MDYLRRDHRRAHHMSTNALGTTFQVLRIARADPLDMETKDDATT